VIVALENNNKMESKLQGKLAQLDYIGVIK